MVKPNIKALSCSWIVWLLVSPTFSPWNHCPVDTGGDNAGVSVRFPGRGTRGDFKFVPIEKRNRWPRAWKSLSQHKQTYRKSEFLIFWLIAPEENSLYHQFSLLHVLLSPYFGGLLITFHPNPRPVAGECCEAGGSQGASTTAPQAAARAGDPLPRPRLRFIFNQCIIKRKQLRGDFFTWKSERLHKNSVRV